METLNSLLGRIVPGRQRKGYTDTNERKSCVCGAVRSDIVNRIFQVTNKETDLIYPKYYYKCVECDSFSAVNIYFPKDMYDDNFQYASISAEKRALALARVAWIDERSSIRKKMKPIVLDLGAGEGAFSHALADAFTDAHVYAVEADARHLDKFYNRNSRVTFVADFIETYLEKSDGLKADLIILTDVLEHLVWPESVLRTISDTLAPGGLLYMTTPNSHTFDFEPPLPIAVSSDKVDWDHANRTRQHIFMMTPQRMRTLIEETMDVIAETQEFETKIRRDSVYSTILAQRRSATPGIS